MIHRLSILIVLAFSITAQAGIRFEDVDAPAVASCIAPLKQNPDADTARLCSASLSQLAFTQPSAQRAASSQVANLITNLFGAEQSYLQARNAITQAEQDARAAEVDARRWLQRNGFGHNNPTLYNNAKNNGQTIRQRAVQNRQAAQSHLAHMLNAGRETVAGLEQVGMSAVSEPLSFAVSAISRRSQQSLPAERDQLANQVLGAVAIAGLLWAGSKLLGGASSNDSSAQDQASQNLANDQILQQRHQYQEEKDARDRAAENRAIEAQHAAWRAENMRPFN